MDSSDRFVITVIIISIAPDDYDAKVVLQCCFKLSICLLV